MQESGVASNFFPAVVPDSRPGQISEEVLSMRMSKACCMLWE